MTTEQAKNKLIAWAVSQIGTREGAGNWNKYAAMPNVERLYGGSIQKRPWCDVFVDAAFVTVFGLKLGAAMTYQTVGNGSALCRTSAAYFQERGAWIPRGRTPDPGDVIFFYVGGVINHMGIVTSVKGGSVITVEGNSGDQVAERCYSVQDGSIAGYGRPRWELAADVTTVDTKDEDVTDTNLGDKPAEPVKRTYLLRLPYLQRGDKSMAVAVIQAALICWSFSCGPDGVDGEFGKNTETAVRKFQQWRELTPDGVIGPATGAALFGGEVVHNINGLGQIMARKIKEGE